MRDANYSFPATIELEYDNPEGSEAVQEVRKCFEYARKMVVGELGKIQLHQSRRRSHLNHFKLSIYLFNDIIIDGD